MIDHFGIKVKNLEASKLFYQKTLAPLGYKIAFDIPQAVSFAEPRNADPTGGGKDNGAPGERSQYHPGYYAAYIIDPDGNNVEVVCHKE